MHNNYYFLRQLSTALRQQLTGWQLTTCFSQNKDELILVFVHPDQREKEFYIKASLRSDFCCLSFPSAFQRSRKNTVDLFPAVIGKTIVGVRQFLNDRSFALILAETATPNQYTLVFKMHGNRSNLILFEEEVLIELFNNRLVKDLDLKLNALDRPLSQTYEDFIKVNGNYKMLFPTFGKVLRQYLAELNFENAADQKKWEILRSLTEKLQNPEIYYITLLRGVPVLSLLELGNILEKWDDPLQAIDRFYLLYNKRVTLETEKQKILRQLEKAKVKCEHNITRNAHRLDTIQNATPYDQIADIIMANLHQIPSGAEKVSLFNFYTNTTMPVKLKKDLTPQKNAEIFYKKSKNKKIEIDELHKNLNQKEELLQRILINIHTVQSIDGFRELKRFLKENETVSDKKSKVTVPYRRFTLHGYEVLVGKNAANNDKMLRDYASKDDLWLHAKDVPGSHVIVKQQSGKNIPARVIEKAAQLAGYYSKRKTETLCPVIYTPRKYVRKSKGMPAGQVIVSREQVMMIVPALVQSTEQ